MLSVKTLHEEEQVIVLGTHQHSQFSLMPGSELAAASMKTCGCESSEEGRYPVHLSGGVLSLQRRLLHWQLNFFWHGQTQEVLDPWRSEFCGVFSARP